MVAEAVLKVVAAVVNCVATKHLQLVENAVQEFAAEQVAPALIAVVRLNQMFEWHHPQKSQLAVAKAQFDLVLDVATLQQHLKKHPVIVFVAFLRKVLAFHSTNLQQNKRKQ